MRTNQLSLDDTVGLGIFDLMARALTPRGGEAENFARPEAAVVEAPEPRSGLLDRLDTWFWRMEQRAVEAHLGKAKDVYDLEARIRHLERGVMYRYG